MVLMLRDSQIQNIIHSIMAKGFPPVTRNNRKLWAQRTEPTVAFKQFLTFDTVVQYSYRRVYKISITVHKIRKCRHYCKSLNC
jgi:hypothetical protein